MISSLSSKQRAVFNEAIQLWNRTFGAAKSLEYPTALLPVLLKLRTLTDISLPTFPEGIGIDVGTMHSLRILERVTNTQQVSSSPLHFTETQIDEEQLGWNRNGTPAKPPTRALRAFRLSEAREDQDEISSRHSRLLAREPAKQSPIEQSLETTPKATSKTTSKTTSKITPKARLRHDDSQIQFAAIESSPLIPETVDSQSLTDHQKEVRERQGLERGAMFPDLRSTPTPKTRIREQDETPLKLILKGTQGSHTKGKVGDDSRILSHVDDNSDDIFGCSPTPRSSRRNSDQLSFSNGTPKSLPSEPETGAESFDDDPTSILNEPKPLVVEMEFENMEIDTDPTPEYHTRNNGEVTTMSKNSHWSHPQQSNTHSEASIDHIRGVPANSSAQDVSDINPSLKYGILIDAAADPVQTVQHNVQEQCYGGLANANSSQEISYPSNDYASCEMIEELNTPAPSTLGNCPEEDANDQIITEGNKVTQFVDSCPETQRSQFTSEDDQIAAQLVSDLERASSQVEAEMKGSLSATREPVKAVRKRKNSFENTPPAKKSKVLPQPQVFQVVIDSRERGAMESECICIEDNDRCYSPAREVNQETSSSHPQPSRSSSRKLCTRKRHRRRVRSSTASDTPRQKSWPVAETLHPQHVKVESESDSQPETSIIAVRSHRQSRRINLPSVESRHARHGFSTKRYETDKGARAADSPSNSSFDGEEKDGGSGIRQMERESHGDDAHTTEMSRVPSGPTTLVREMCSDRVVTDDQDNRLSFRSPEIRSSASPNDEMQTEEEQAASLSETTGSCSSEDEAVQPTIREASQQVAMETQAPRHDFQGLLAGFRRLLGDIRQVRLGAEEEREMIGVMFECVGEVHEAGRRSTST